MNNKLSVQDVDRCVKCGHERRFSDNENGVCEKYLGPHLYCRCYCVFPSPSVSEAEDKNSVSGASDYSTSRITKDISLDAARKIAQVLCEFCGEEGYDLTYHHDEWRHYRLRDMHVEYCKAHMVYQLYPDAATQDAKSSEASHSPELSQDRPASPSDSKSSESESTPDVQAADVVIALDESVKLQSHYAVLLNQHDGGERLPFENATAWIARLREVGKLAASPVQPEVSKEQDNDHHRN